MTDRCLSYLAYNTQISLLIVEKALAVLLVEKFDPISSTEDATNTELLSVKSSDTNTDFISRMKPGISNVQG